MGVSTSSTASPATMAANIKKIETDVTHTVEVSAPFDYANDKNGLTVKVDGVTVYTIYGQWTARSWSGKV